MSQFAYMPMVFWGEFDSFEAAMECAGATATEIARAIAGAKAAGKRVITLYPPSFGPIGPVVCIRPSAAGATAWVGDEGSTFESREEADAFMRGRKDWILNIVPAPHAGMVA